MHPVAIATLRRLLPALAALGRSREERGLAVQEARNKVAITALVADPRMSEKTGPQTRPLAEQVARCYQLGDYPALWAIEGLGLRHAARALARERGSGPRELLADATLPASSLPMLHAGVGLAFARAGLAGTRPEQRARLEHVVRRFLARCQANGRRGYVGAAIESLGLVARFYHGPRMVRALARVLATRSPAARGWLWHGAGRALYFAPRNGLPGRRAAMWSIGQCQREAGDDLEAAQNLLAGNLWAVTLVNSRHPPVIAGILAADHDILERGDAAASGVASALLLRQWTTPGWSGLRALLEYEPGAGTSAGRWDRLFADPGRVALETRARAVQVEDVFRYQPLTWLRRP